MGLLVAYGGKDGSEPRIYDRFADDVGSGLRSKRDFVGLGFRDVVLFELGLDCRIDGYLGDGPDFWEFVRAREIKGESR